MTFEWIMIIAFTVLLVIAILAIKNELFEESEEDDEERFLD